jgi:hypothetical protein
MCAAQRRFINEHSVAITVAALHQLCSRVLAPEFAPDIGHLRGLASSSCKTQMIFLTCRSASSSSVKIRSLLNWRNVVPTS